MIQIQGSYEVSRDFYEAHKDIADIVDNRINNEMIIKFAEEMQKNNVLKIEKRDNHNRINYHVNAYVMNKEDFNELELILNDLKNGMIGISPVRRLENLIYKK